MRTEPVLLVHGFASSFELNWRKPGWVDLLRESGRTVIGPDLLGHGTAAKPHDPESYKAMELSLLDHLPESPVDAIGFSMGAQLLLRLAAQSPERFARLIVAGVGERSFESNDPEPVAQAIESGDSSGEGGTLARAFAQFGAGSANDPKALAACMRARRAPLTAEEVARISIPVLVVLGDRDFVGTADRLMAALPNARLVTLRGVDHFGTPQSFGFIDAALEFIDAVPS